MANETIIMPDAGNTVVDGGSTEIQGKGKESLFLLEPALIELHSDDGPCFSIDTARELGSGGEAVVVIATDEDGAEYAAKITPPAVSTREQKNRRKVLDFLQEQSAGSSENFRYQHLMPVYAHGTIHAMRAGGEIPEPFSVAIMPICRCLGDEVLDVSFVKERVVPAVSEAIHFLHENRIVHRDVKPSNIFEHQGEVVLGDFGISTVFEEGEQARGTVVDRRTPGYTPYNHVVQYEDDWYSFGYTIWTMYNGNVHPHQAWIDSNNLYLIEQRGERPVAFVPKDPADKTLGELIYGLTAMVWRDRLGYEDVRSWIENPDEFHYVDKGAAPARRPYEFEGDEYFDDASLAKALSQKWDEAKSHLYSRTLEEYFKKNDETDLSSKLYDIVEGNPSTAKDKDLGLAEAIYLISGEEQLMSWKARDVSLPALAIAFSEAGVDGLSAYDDVLSSPFLTWAMDQQDGEEANVYRSVFAEASTTTARFPRFARCIVQFAVAGGGPSEYAGFECAEDLIGYALETPKRFYDAAGSDKRVDELFAAFVPYFASAGRLNSLVKLRESCSDDVVANANKLLTFFDSVDGGSVAARRFFVRFSWHAAWFWMAKHAGSYRAEPGHATADAAIKALGACAFDEKDSVAKIAISGEEVRNKAQSVLALMSDSPLFSRYGVFGEHPVIATSEDALVCAEFYDRRVPRGFARDLLIASGCASAADWKEVELLGKAAVGGAVDQLDEFISPCSRALDAAQETKASVGSFAKAVARFIVCLLAGIALFAFLPSFAEGCSGLIGQFLASFFGSVQKAAEFVRPFSIVTTAAMIAFLFVDAGYALFASSRSGKATAVQSRYEGKAREMKKAAQAFRSGEHELVCSLRSVESNQEIHPEDVSAEAAEATKRVASLSARDKDLAYKVVWQATAILATLFVFAVFAPYLASMASMEDMDLMGVMPFLSILWIVAHCAVAAFLSHRWCNAGTWALLLMVPLALMSVVLVVMFVVQVLVALIAVILGGLAVLAVFAGLLSS